MGSYFGELTLLILVLAGVSFIKHYLEHGDTYGGFFTGYGGSSSQDSLDFNETIQLKKAAKAEKYTRKKAIMNNTAIFLPRIGKDFPGFNYPEMQSRV